MSQPDFANIKKLAEEYKPDMTRFLRDMIRLPSESCSEKAVVERIKAEMEKVGFDKVAIDPLGNVLGSNSFNLMLIGGALALSTPFVLSSSLLMFDGAVMAGATLALLAVMAITRRISRAVGLIFLVCYAGYIAAQFVQQNAP